MILHFGIKNAAILGRLKYVACYFLLFFCGRPKISSNEHPCPNLRKVPSPLPQYLSVSDWLNLQRIVCNIQTEILVFESNVNVMFDYLQ